MGFKNVFSQKHEGCKICVLSSRLFYAQDLFISKSNLNYYIQLVLKDTFGVGIFIN